MTALAGVALILMLFLREYSVQGKTKKVRDARVGHVEDGTIGTDNEGKASTAEGAEA